MKNTPRLFEVSVALTTNASLFVQANSEQEAKAAVQEDIQSGGKTLGDWLISVENAIPFSGSEVTTTNVVVDTDQEPDFWVGPTGKLSKTQGLSFA